MSRDFTPSSFDPYGLDDWRTDEEDLVSSAYLPDGSRNERLHVEIQDRFKKRLRELDAYLQSRESGFRDPLSMKFFTLSTLIDVLSDEILIGGNPDLVSANTIYDRILEIPTAVDGINQGDREHLFDSARSLVLEYLRNYLHGSSFDLDPGKSVPLYALANELSSMLRVAKAGLEKGFSSENF